MDDKGVPRLPTTPISLKSRPLNSQENLKDAGRRGLKVGLSSMGIVVNVVDAVIKFDDANERLKKGDLDAGLLTVASAALIIFSIPFGLAGSWVGAALAIVAGILGIIASFVTDDTWDMFIDNTVFGEGVGSFSPDWAGIPLFALKVRPTLQLRALGNLLHNFTVTQRAGATNPGKGFGTYTLHLKMATPDPMAIFVLTWHFTVSGEPGVQQAVTVASAFEGTRTDADGNAVSMLSGLETLDGHSLGSLEKAAVQLESTATFMKIGDAWTLRHSKGRVGKRVEIRRLRLHSFGRPRAVNGEWMESLIVDLTKPHSKVKLFKD